jgi:hypothetical protein
LPLESVVTVWTECLSTSVMVTCAPAMAAPLGSEMTPLTWATEVACAHADGWAVKKTNIGASKDKLAKVNRDLLFMTNYPSLEADFATGHPRGHLSARFGKCTHDSETVSRDM